MSAKQALNDKSQGSVAAYLRCGGVVNNQIKKCLLSLSEKKLKSVNIWQSYTQEHDCLVHFLRLLAVCWLGNNIHLTANLLRNLSVNFFNRLRFYTVMVVSLWPRFFGVPCRPNWHEQVDPVSPSVYWSRAQPSAPSPRPTSYWLATDSPAN